MVTYNGYESPWDIAGDDVGHSTAIQPDGKIVVVGNTTREISGTNLLILRYNANGSADTTFGYNGVANYHRVEDIDDIGHAVTLQIDGKIVIVGGGYYNTSRGMLVLRLAGADTTPRHRHHRVRYRSNELNGTWRRRGHL